MSKVDVEKLARGSNEINRMLQVIYVVSGGIVSAYDRVNRKVKPIWHLDQQLVSVGKPGQGELIIHCPKYEGRFEVAYKDPAGTITPIYHSIAGKESFSWKLIPEAFVLLGDLIEAAEEAMPEAGIMTDALFMMNQDPQGD